MLSISVFSFFPCWPGFWSCLLPWTILCYLAGFGPLSFSPPPPYVLGPYPQVGPPDRGIATHSWVSFPNIKSTNAILHFLLYDWWLGHGTPVSWYGLLILGDTGSGLCSFTNKRESRSALGLFLHLGIEAYLGWFPFNIKVQMYITIYWVLAM